MHWWQDFSLNYLFLLPIFPPTRPVENVALATKGLQERKQLVSGTTVEK